MESLVFTNSSPSSIIERVESYEYIRVDKKDGIAEIVLCRPKKLNTMTDTFFIEFVSVMEEIQKDASVRVVIVWGEGKMFSAGLQLNDEKLSSLLMSSDESQSQASINLTLFRLIRRWQAAFDKLYSCSKPVIAAIHNMCIGGAVDLVTACDIRLCTEDAVFTIKETQLAIVADLGTLQRITRIVGPGFAREMAFTGGKINAEAALRAKLVNHVYKDQETLLREARKLAAQIAANSPLVVQSTKLIMNHADDHRIEEGLLRVALHNAAFLKSEDLTEAISGFMEKRTPIFKSNL